MTRVDVFVPGFYSSTIFNLSQIPADEIVVHYPQAAPSEAISKRRSLPELNLTSKLRLIQEPIMLHRLDPVKLLRGNFTLNSFFRFDLGPSLLTESDVVITIEPHTMYSFHLAKLAKRQGRKFIILSENDPSLAIPNSPPLPLS